MSGVHLIVGGTSGIGAATVAKLVERGAAVVFCGRREPEGRAIEASLRARGDVRFVRADVTSTIDLANLFEIVAARGPLHGAFNCSGILGQDSALRGVRFHESAETNFDTVFDVNVKGLWRCMQSELAIMTRQGFGAIVNCASVAGLRAADSASASYTASKHAVVGLTRATAVEYASANIRINAVCPGVIRTPMLGTLEDALTRDLRKKNPGARLGTSEEVAAVVDFLLSSSSSYVNGVALAVDAGGLYGAL